MDPMFKIFWAGLKRTASHKSKAKTPLTIALLDGYLEHRLKSRDPVAGLRDSAWASFCFFGVRRVSEGRNLKRSDVRVVTENDIVTGLEV